MLESRFLLLTHSLRCDTSGLVIKWVGKGFSAFLSYAFCLLEPQKYKHGILTWDSTTSAANKSLLSDHAKCSNLFRKLKSWSSLSTCKRLRTGCVGSLGITPHELWSSLRICLLSSNKGSIQHCSRSPLVNKHSYWKRPFLVSFPIENGDFP